VDTLRGVRGGLEGLPRLLAEVGDRGEGRIASLVSILADNNKNSRTDISLFAVLRTPQASGESCEIHISDCRERVEWSNLSPSSPVLLWNLPAGWASYPAQIFSHDT
jgi:hypothetical protein